MRPTKQPNQLTVGQLYDLFEYFLYFFFRLHLRLAFRHLHNLFVFVFAGATGQKHFDCSTKCMCLCVGCAARLIANCLHILSEKRRKNPQPTLLFQSYWYCAGAGACAFGRHGPGHFGGVENCSNRKPTRQNSPVNLQTQRARVYIQ